MEKKKSAVIYIHGKGGNAGESEHYRKLFPDSDIIGFDYSSEYPWEAAVEFAAFFDEKERQYDKISVIAVSIGAYFLISSVSEESIHDAYFISPVTDMEALILSMMSQAGVTEEYLQKKKNVTTKQGEVLSWDYLTYVREHPVLWNSPVHILCGSCDVLVPYERVCELAHFCNGTVTVMEGGEHWFHTPEQMEFLDNWIIGLRA